MPTSTSSFSFQPPFPASSSSTMADPSSPSPSLKQRRVSLALPSTPRVVQPWSFRDDTTIDSHPQPQQQHASSSSTSSEKRGKMRKISPTTGLDDNDSSLALPVQEKKPRKKWTPEETQMLVDGCQRVCFVSFFFLLCHIHNNSFSAQHGVGNWKTILSDPDLKFDNRSPVDLKDRCGH